MSGALVAGSFPARALCLNEVINKCQTAQPTSICGNRITRRLNHRKAAAESMAACVSAAGSVLAAEGLSASGTSGLQGREARWGASARNPSISAGAPSSLEAWRSGWTPRDSPEL